MSLLSSMAFALSSLMKRSTNRPEVMKMETATVTLPSSIRRTEETELPFDQQANPQSPEP